MKTILNIKTDKQLKQDAQSIAKELGIPLSTVINAFLRQFIRDKEVTFSAEKYRMTTQLKKLVHQARKEHAKKETVGPFASVDDMIKSLDK